MRKLSLTFACVAGVIAGPSCLAGSPLYSFVKADATEDQFRHDRNACMAEATVAYRGGCSSHMAFAANGPHGALQAYNETSCYSPSGLSRSTSTPHFLRCMTAKGYRQSAPAMPAGRPGLYELRKFSNLAMVGRRDLAGTMPFVQHRASAEALAQPGPVFQLCVPPDGAQPLGAVAGLSASCTYSNVVSTERGFSADARCQGGRFIRITFDTPAPDRSEFTVIGERKANAAVPHIEKYRIAWVSSDCGGLPPKSVRAPDGKLVATANSAPAIRSCETTVP
jgi:hypothetical protein